MHIVYVTGDFAGRQNDPLTGMPNYVYKIARYMMSRDHCVEIVTVGNRDRIWRYNGVSVYTCEWLQTGNRLFDSIKRERLFNDTIDKINEIKKIDIVQYAGWNGVGMLYSGKYPSVLRISTFSKIQLKSRLSRRELFLINYMEKRAGTRFDKIISPSKVLGIPYSQFINRKVDIIETPLDLGKSDEDDSIYKEKLCGRKYILFFGRLSPDKGLLTISRSIHRILVENRDVLFCFCGEPAALSYNPIKLLIDCAAECGDRVVYCGNLLRYQLYPIVRNAECVILPSLMDNIPNACLEALALNGLVIGTRGASFDEIFRDNISGFLIEIDNDEELVKKVGYVLGLNENRKGKIREEARRELARYDANVAGKKLEDYYFNLLSNKSC